VSKDAVGFFYERDGMDQMKLFPDPVSTEKAALAVCWGAGWDSTAMLIEMEKRGIRPDLITFADVGGEKPGTYEFLPVFAEWCRDVDFPEPTTCVRGTGEETLARYRSAVVQMSIRLGVKLTVEQTDRLSRLFGNMLANETMPSIAFGGKSCSVRWKIEAQEFQ